MNEFMQTKASVLYTKLLNLWIDRQLLIKDTKAVETAMCILDLEIQELRVSGDQTEVEAIYLFYVDGTGWKNYDPILDKYLLSTGNNKELISQELNLLRVPDGTVISNFDLEFLDQDFEPINSVEELNVVYSKLTDSIETSKAPLEKTILKNKIAQLEKELSDEHLTIVVPDAKSVKAIFTKETVEEEIEYLDGLVGIDVAKYAVARDIAKVEDSTAVMKYITVGALATAACLGCATLWFMNHTDVIVIDNDFL